MELAVFFGKNEKLANVLEALKAVCTITAHNPASVSVQDEDDKFYFQIDVDLSLDQLKAALNNHTDPLAVPAASVIGWNSQMQWCLSNHAGMFTTWYVWLVFTEDKKLIANITGEPTVMFASK